MVKVNANDNVSVALLSYLRTMINGAAAQVVIKAKQVSLGLCPAITSVPSDTI